MKRYIAISFVLIMFGCFFTGCKSTIVEPEPVDVTQEQQGQASNPEIIKIQEDIVELCERIFSDTQIKMENAQATLQDLVESRAKLAEARIKLGEFQDRADIVVQELQNLVQFYVNTRGEYLERLESGTGKGKELYEIEIALMETNIRLTETITKLYPLGVQLKEE